MLAKATIAFLACALLGAVAITPPASADATGCGTDATTPATAGWTCTFADEFNGSTLDRDNWAVMTTATSGFTHAWECYVDDPANVSVASGALRLTSTKSSAPQACGSLFSTPYRSGMVFSKHGFSQAYGRFEARIRFPRGTGFTSSWWLWPRDMAYGRQSGEIDIAEHYGSHPRIVSPYVHIIGPGGEERGRGEYCNVADPGGGFHTYALEWHPSGRLVFLYDGVTCMTFDQWDPGSPLTYPQPFDKAFFLNFTLAHGYPPNAVGADTPFPATMAIDYVRVWSAKPDDAPPATPITRPTAEPAVPKEAEVRKLKVASTTLPELLRSRRLKVRVALDGPGTVRLAGTGSGRRGKSRPVFEPATLRFAKAGTKARELKLTKAGRRALSRRARATVKITARLVDGAGNRVRKQQRLKLTR